MNNRSLMGIGVVALVSLGPVALVAPPPAPVEEILGSGVDTFVEEHALEGAFNTSQGSAPHRRREPDHDGSKGGRIPLIIDTDPAIGYPFRDVDDGLALLMALESTETEVIGITVTTGNVDQERAAETLLEFAHRPDIPILAGSPGGGPGGNIAKASTFLVESSYEYPGELVILALGALTNVAAAIEQDPQLPGRVRKIVSLGGIAVAPGAPPPRRPVDINFGADPAAVRVTLESGAPVALMTVNTAIPFVLEADRYSRMVSDNAPYGSYLAASTRSWYLSHFGSFVVWDVVALAYVAHPEWFNAVKGNLEVREVGDLRGRVIVSPKEGGGTDITLPTAIMQEGYFWRWFDSLLCEPMPAAFPLAERKPQATLAQLRGPALSPAVSDSRNSLAKKKVRLLLFAGANSLRPPPYHDLLKQIAFG